MAENAPLIRAFDRWFLLRVGKDGSLSLVNPEGFQTHEGLRRAIFERETEPGDLFVELQGWKMEYDAEKR